MGTNGNGEEIGWNKSENVLAPGSQPPSQTPYESACRGDDDIWFRDPDVDGRRKGRGLENRNHGGFSLSVDEYESPI